MAKITHKNSSLVSEKQTGTMSLFLRRGRRALFSQSPKRVMMQQFYDENTGNGNPFHARAASAPASDFSKNSFNNYEEAATMEFNFSGKTVVITGGTAGIGLATAKMFCKYGANVVICGRDPKKLESAVSNIKNAGGTIVGAICDATSRDQQFALADKAVEEFGGIDVWVNNAGHTGTMGLMRVTEEFCENEVGLNFKSILWGSQAAYKYMRSKGGVILNASSYSAVTPGVGSGLYAASKSAVSSITRTLASELNPYGIRVAGYLPGPVHTPLLEESMVRSKQNLKDHLARIAMTISLRRVGHADEVAKLIMFLASEHGAFINGTCVEISGGKFATQNAPTAWSKNNTVLYGPDNLPPEHLSE